MLSKDFGILSSYDVFAQFYDDLTSDIDYAKRALYFDEIIKKYSRSNNEYILDLACGTGSMSYEFEKLGYKIVATDFSEEMLFKASEKLSETALLLSQSMQELSLPFQVDNVICALDSLNHVTDDDDVELIFKNVNENLAPGGLFIFDVNTEYKHNKILADNTFIYDLEEVYLVWDNEYDQNIKQTEIFLDFFIPADGNSYERYSEHFLEMFHEDIFLKTALKNAELELLEVFHEDSFQKPKEDSQRLIYICRKKEGL